MKCPNREKLEGGSESYALSESYSPPVLKTGWANKVINKLVSWWQPSRCTVSWETSLALGSLVCLFRLPFSLSLLVSSITHCNFIEQSQVASEASKHSLLEEIDHESFTRRGAEPYLGAGL